MFVISIISPLHTHSYHLQSQSLSYPTTFIPLLTHTPTSKVHNILHIYLISLITHSLLVTHSKLTLNLTQSSCRTILFIRSSQSLSPTYRISINITLLHTLPHICFYTIYNLFKYTNIHTFSKSTKQMNRLRRKSSDFNLSILIRRSNLCCVITVLRIITAS